ncbi:MAG TPA: hypothetical protein VG939_08985 [Caulobacteraceae bacterium]|nr:hypothetical protein [Caulobacteraceae bacterium]
MARALPLAMILALAAGPAALADEAIPTAGAAKAPPQAAASVPPVDDEDAAPLRTDDAPPQIGPCGPVRHTADGKRDDRAHGAVEVGVGTSGYRHVGGYVCKPLGDHGAVAIAVDHTEWNGRGRFR